MKVCRVRVVERDGLQLGFGVVAVKRIEGEDY